MALSIISTYNIIRNFFDEVAKTAGKETRMLQYDAEYGKAEMLLSIPIKI